MPNRLPPPWHAPDDDKPTPPEKQPVGRKKMTEEELQSAADWIRQGFDHRHEGSPAGYDYPNGARSITVTQGMLNGKWVFTVSTSAGSDGRNGNLKSALTDRERERAMQVFGPTGFTEVREVLQRPSPRNAPPNHSEQRGARATPRNAPPNHSEQRGARATCDQLERSQATSNASMPGFGEPCPDCRTAQETATDSKGRSNRITNVTDRQKKYKGAPWGDWSKHNSRR